jgi:peptidoglycan/LPS O-acetylase OafA/YrhL
MGGHDTSGRSNSRLEFLDAQRGVAAFCVVLLHLFSFQMLPRVLPNAYLAVDFFFVLSGFVLAHAYGHRLGLDMSFREFAMSRIIRLYPLALVSMLIGLSIILLKYLAYPDKVPHLPVILQAAALNLFILPDLAVNKLFKTGVFPLNGPIWSLSLELFFNLLWAGVVVHLKNRD